jgi:cation diffusion facilitator CzcD-associated flavoprotein CzcO
MKLDHEVCIVGSGFSGIGAAVSLQQIGTRDFVILERESEPGGTWVQHDYPGLEVDMPFFIYSYPFEMKPDWQRMYPSAAELNAYTRHCIAKYDLARRIRCGSAVTRAEYQADDNAWRVELENGDVLVSRYLVNATGLLVIPKMPDISGIEGFEGTLVHSARWDPELDLSGKRVAVIGTGATAVQLIPAIAEKVERLDVYQRTPIWLLPKPNPELSDRVQRALRSFPFLQTLTRWATNLFVEITMGMGFVRYKRFPWIFDFIEKKLVDYIRSEVDDPKTQDALIPDYSFFCKRPSFSNVFYSTFNRENVELVTDPIERVTGRSVVTASGKQREIDVLVCATGYNVFNRRCMPGYAVVGRDGRDLGAFWEDERFQAYEGASVPGFPNLFLFMGPYSAAGASYFTMIDTQSQHMKRCLVEARRRGTDYVEVKKSAHDRDFAKVMRRRKDTVLFGGSCATSNSYYFDERGDTPGLRPVTGFEHWLASRFFPLGDYEFERS